MAGLAELESDLKKYGSFIIMGFRRYSSFIGSSPSSIDISLLENHFEFEARNIDTPIQGTAIFFFESDFIYSCFRRCGCRLLGTLHSLF